MNQGFDIIKATKPAIVAMPNQMQDAEALNEDGMDFLSLVLDSLNSKEALNVDSKFLAQKVAKIEGFQPKMHLQNDEKSNQVLLNNANFIQILSLLETLNGGKKIDKFPTFSNNLANVLSFEKNVNEIKGAKNLLELIQIAKKFDLGLDKIDIKKSNLQALKENFPNLHSKNFFKFDEMAFHKIKFAPIKSEVEKIIKEKTPQKEQNEINLSKILKEIKEVKDSSNLAKTTQQAVIDDEVKPLKTKSEPSIGDYLNQIQKKADEKGASELKNQISEKLNQKTENKPSNLDLGLEVKSEKGEAKEVAKNEVQSENFIKDIVANAKLQVKNHQIKQTFESFASNLQEKIAEYKPPVTRFHMTLNPSNLGEVEVTLFSRGNNLHINFTSSSQTMQIFLQNQSEFKASLVNMGFSELSMNFNDQGKKEHNQNKKTKEFNEELDANDEEMIEITIPKYF